MTKGKRKDTSVSLHPLPFEDAIRALVTPKREDSEAEVSDNTRASAPESETSEPQTAPRQTSSDD